MKMTRVVSTLLCVVASQFLHAESVLPASEQTFTEQLIRSLDLVNSSGDVVYDNGSKRTNGSFQCGEDQELVISEQKSKRRSQVFTAKPFGYTKTSFGSTEMLGKPSDFVHGKPVRAKSMGFLRAVKCADSELENDKLRFLDSQEPHEATQNHGLPRLVLAGSVFHEDFEDVQMDVYHNRSERSPHVAKLVIHGEGMFGKTQIIEITEIQFSDVSTSATPLAVAFSLSGDPRRLMVNFEGARKKSSTQTVVTVEQ